MLFIICSIFIGLLLIYLEFFFPGKLLAIIGAACLLSTIAYLLFRGYSPFALLITLVLITCVLFFIFKMGFSHHRKKYALQKEKEEKEDSFALTDLNPAGFISFKGKKVAGRAKKEWILRGSSLVILEEKNGEYLVEEREK
jgi:membrane-bound ClpP family serine protease